MQPPGIKQTLNKLERAFWFHSRRHGLSQVPVTELELVALHGWAGYLCQSKWMKNTDLDRQISLRCDWMVWSSPKPSQIFTGDNDSAELDKGRVTVSWTALWHEFGVLENPGPNRASRRPGFDLWVGKIPWRRKWQPTPIFLPGEFHRQSSLVGCIPWGCKKSDRTERLHFHVLFFSLVYNLHFVKKYVDLHLYPCLMPSKSSGRSEVRPQREIQGHLDGL